MTHSSASPKAVARKSILGTLPVIIAIMSIVITVGVSLAITFFSMSTHKARSAERIDQLSALVAPDLAWRETERLKHVIDVELAGNGLFLDANGLVVAGNETLIEAPRYEVSHKGRHVGYIVSPNMVRFEVIVPYWLVMACSIFGIFVSVATARYLSAHISTSVEQLTEFASTFGKSSKVMETPGGEFAELTQLRIAMSRAAARTHNEYRRLRDAAFTDTVTGLPNLNHLREAMSSSVGSMTVNLPGAYVLLDLDGFVRASETLGPGGDRKLLGAAVTRMKQVLEDFETNASQPLLANLQSDNFGLFIPVCPNGRDDVSAIVRRLNAAFEAPLKVRDRLVTLGISGGITMLPEDGTSPEEVQRHAAMALQQARNTAGNGFQFYAPRFDRVAKGRYQLESELRQASEKSEFIPVFQPKIEFSTGRIIGAEALARWRRDGGKIVMPGTFIGVAEEIGLIEEIGRQILEASCMAAAEWKRLGHDIAIAVNVSPRQFEQRNFTETVINALKMSGLPPRLLELEITESMAVQDPHKVADVMRPLRAMGVGLAIDDFGTGHSNLATLTQLPFDVFKIDRQFVSALQTDRQAPAIVEMILAMAETLGLKTVAEGVETEQHAEFLRRRGCTLGQGFLYSPGIPQEEFLNLLRTWRGHGNDLMKQSAG